SLEADSRSGEQDEIREQGLIAASRADSLSERLEGVSRELKRVNDWIDNLEGRKEGLESLAETLAAKQAELAGRIEELAAASRDLPQELARREESLKSLRQQIEGNRVLLQAKEEEAKQSRKSREQIAKKLASLERGLIESSYGFDKINDDLLKEWRVILVDPLAPAPVQLVSKSLQEGEPPMGGETMASTETDGAVEGQLSPDSQPLPGEGETSPDGQSLPGEGESSPDGQSLPGEGQGLPEQGAPGENEDVSAHEALPPPETIDPNELAGLELPEMAEATIMSLREKLSALGEISLEAIKEEAELNKSYGFQKTHYDDLVAAIADLRKSIVQLNVTCKERFKKTFTQADQKFREIFPVLFEGGEGWLRLTDETDPLECGVEIHVHPPGKKIMVMRSLSGGEKTLTSLCLIFALYLIKPSPFCLLDEADAPLDEANIDRFNRLLRNLSQASQIIMVTHNKRTMQISDTLFGVTMETPGVSRLVSVNLAEAEVLTNA
ncbi:MAG: AAA family ATPase, partial [Deltaproteobacteria bacterium]|nr:AAA family ATPase [Deltaproteobacteria bacterium]